MHLPSCRLANLRPLLFCLLALTQTRAYGIVPNPVPYGVNLLVNGNAESGLSSSTGAPVAIPGWTASPFMTVIPYGAPGGFPTASDPGPPDRANQFFAGGNALASSATQDINVSGNAADINAGRVTVDLSAWLGGFVTDPDNAQLDLTFLDGGAMTLGSITIGPVSPADRGNATGLILRRKTIVLPAGTVTLRATLTMTRSSGAFNDGYADSLSVVLRAPAVVTTTADSGAGSLRAALAAGNVITFDPGVFAANTAPHVISLTSALPAMFSDITITGPGANRLTVNHGLGADFGIFTVDSGMSVTVGGQAPRVTISGLTIANGKVTSGDGSGGIYNLTGAITVESCRLTQNSAPAGGAIFCAQGTRCDINNSTIDANTVDTDGAALYLYNAAGTLHNTTVSGNFSGSARSDIVAYGDGTVATLELDSCTIVSQHSIETLTHHTSGVAQVFLGNTILFSTSDANNLSSIGGEFISFDHNLSNRPESTTLNQPHDRNSTDPTLGPLQDNGGPTLTRALLPGSLAIDKGDTSRTTDQRGAHRPFDDPNSTNGGGNDSDIGAYEFQGVPPMLLANVSTRLRVETGDNALIGGFIVTGWQPKKVIIRAIGPSLPLAGKLADPVLELHDSSGALIASNDNWRSSQEAEIIATTIPPANDLESAIVATLPANGAGYTAIVRGTNNGTGIGVVEAYDLDHAVDSKLANISTRGLVQTGDDVLIAGTIVIGPLSQGVIIRAIGPSLPFAGKLADPTMELRDANGGLIRANDNWRTDQEAIILQTGIPPSNDLESAIVANLPANGASYTAIVRGAGGTTGIAVVEVYAITLTVQ
jgi:hypothetical protein